MQQGPVWAWPVFSSDEAGTSFRKTSFGPELESLGYEPMSRMPPPSDQSSEKETMVRLWGSDRRLVQMGEISILDRPTIDLALALGETHVEFRFVICYYSRSLKDLKDPRSSATARSGLPLACYAKTGIKP